MPLPIKIAKVPADMDPNGESTLKLSVIVPTMNEAGNIAPLVEALSHALAGVDAEIIFVDDSRDETPQIIDQVAAATEAITVRGYHRPAEARNGLSGAVVDGLREARGTWVCVMDGDLQHPPHLVPELLRQAQRVDADMVVASRKATSLGPEGLSLFRTLTSQTLTILARALFPRSLKDVSDPLTGFFLVRRNNVILDRLEPEGFKILLEILVRCPDMRITELLFDFGERHEGESKADFREGMRFFRHLWRLRVTAHQRPMGRYLLVALISFILNNLLFVWGTPRIGMLWSAVLAAELAGLWAFWGNTRFVFPAEENLRPKFWRYLGRNQIFLLFVHLPIIALLGGLTAWPLLVINTAAILLSAVVRYMLSDRWIWTRDLIAHDRPLAFYRIYDQLHIETPIPLPMLSHFQVDRLDRPAEIRIRLDRHGTPRQIRDTVSYDEGLGRFGYAVTVHPTAEYAEVVVSPLVQRSATVLYSNVVEPLMKRFLSRSGWRLVQAGGWQEPDGEIVLVTDSDKAQIVAQVTGALASESARRLVGAEQVFITPTREVYPFPTPLTAGKWLQLNWIRALGATLRRWGMPVATIHTLVQWLLPPRLTPIDSPVGSPGPLGRVIGVDSNSTLEAVEETIEQNGQDPYGFPMIELIDQVTLTG